MLGAREQQRTGHVRESHVQHKHQSGWRESRSLWPQSQHHLHNGLMSAECEWKTERERERAREETSSHCFALSAIYIDLDREWFIFPPDSYDRQTRRQLIRNTKHTLSNTFTRDATWSEPQWPLRAEGEEPHLPVAWRAEAFLHSVSVGFMILRASGIKKKEYFLLCCTNTMGDMNKPNKGFQPFFVRSQPSSGPLLTALELVEWWCRRGEEPLNSPVDKRDRSLHFPSEGVFARDEEAGEGAASRLTGVCAAVGLLSYTVNFTS